MTRRFVIIKSKSAKKNNFQASKSKYFACGAPEGRIFLLKFQILVKHVIAVCIFFKTTIIYIFKNYGS